MTEIGHPVFVCVYMYVCLCVCVHENVFACGVCVWAGEWVGVVLVAFGLGH